MHTFTARTHLVGAVAARQVGIPLLWRICDDTLPDWLLRLFSRVPRHIVSVSRWLTSRYPHIRFDGFVPDGARPPRAITQAEARAALCLAPDDLIIAHVGRLVRWKGQAVLLHALADLYPHISHLRGLFVGGWSADDDVSGPLGGGAPYLKELQALAAGLNLEDRVTFTGFLSEPALGYAAADIVTHTSILPEPFGRVVIEAMLAGRPVVATDAGAIPEIITPGESGVLVPVNHPSALANALTQLIGDPGLRTRLGESAQRRVADEFSLDKMVERMQSAYQSALAKS